VSDDAAVQWEQHQMSWTATAHGCALRVSLTNVMNDWPSAWLWSATLGNDAALEEGRASVGHYPGRSLADAQQAALERAQRECVEAARDLATRSGLAAALARAEAAERERDGLRAGIRAVLDVVPEEAYGIAARLEALLSGQGPQREGGDRDGTR
jgi:hypothetical protein